MSFDRARYNAAVARNNAALITNVSSGNAQFGDVLNNQTLPSTNILFKNATLEQLQQTASSISNPGAYDSNREQLEPSFQQITDKINQLSQTVPVIPAPVMENPPPQVNRSLSITDTIQPIPVIPAPIVENPPIMARDTNIATPSTSIFSSAKPLVLIGVALFAGASLFLTPKASKRR